MFQHLPISLMTAMAILIRMPDATSYPPSEGPTRRLMVNSLSELNQFDTDVLEQMVASYAVGMRRWTEYPPLSLGAGDEAKLWILNRYVFSIPASTVIPYYNAAFRPLESQAQVGLFPAVYLGRGKVLDVQKLEWPLVSSANGIALSSDFVDRSPHDYFPLEEFRSFRKRFERRPPGPRVALTYPPRQGSDTPNDRLRRAIRNENAAATKQALLDGADPNSRNAEGEPIIFSVNHKYRQIMRDMLLAGANPNAKASGRITILERVIRSGCSPLGGNLPTHEDTLIVIEWLLLKGAKTVKLPIHDPSNASIPCDEMRPKIQALYDLVAQAARVKPAASQAKNTPNDRLRRAVLSESRAYSNEGLLEGRAATTQALLDGADPNCRDDKGEPIIFSINNKYRLIMRDMLLAGANPNIKASNGRSILEHAIHMGCYQMGGNLPTFEDTLIVIEWLLLKGVKPAIADPSGSGIRCFEMGPKIQTLYDLAALKQWRRALNTSNKFRPVPRAKMNS